MDTDGGRALGPDKGGVKVSNVLFQWVVATPEDSALCGECDSVDVSEWREVFCNLHHKYLAGDGPEKALRCEACKANAIPAEGFDAPTGPGLWIAVGNKGVLLPGRVVKDKKGRLFASLINHVGYHIWAKQDDFEEYSCWYPITVPEVPK